MTGKKEIVFNWSSPFTIFGLITVPRSKWTTIEQHFKLSVVKLMFKIYHDLTPACMSTITIDKRKSKHSLSGANILNVPRFMKQSIAYRGATLGTHSGMPSLREIKKSQTLPN